MYLIRSTKKGADIVVEAHYDFREDSGSIHRNDASWESKSEQPSLVIKRRDTLDKLKKKKNRS